MTNLKKNIAFAGLRYSNLTYVVKPLVKGFNEKGYNVFYFHLNSYKDKLPVKDLHSEEGVFVYDIGLHSHDELKQFLQGKNINTLLCIGYKSLFDIYINQFARSLGIKTIYFEHGLFIKGLGDKYQMSSVTDTVRRYSILFYKYFIFLQKENLSITAELKKLKRCIYNEDFRSNGYDNALFYTNKGLDSINKYFNFDLNKVYYSGYPIFQTITQQQHQPTNSAASENKKVLYIHQPLIKDKLCTYTREEEHKYFVTISNILRHYGYSLDIKLHPRDIELVNESTYVGDNINFISKGDLYSMIKDYSLIIGQFSTALFFAVYYKTPIIIFPYPDSKIDSHFYDVFNQLGPIVNDYSEFEGVISDIDQYKLGQLKSYKGFTNDYLGYPNSFEDQVDKILAISTDTSTYR